MKLGLLTFHSQLNYGGVLQAFALRTELERLGNTVQTLDWWFDNRNQHLLGPLVCGTSKERIRTIKHMLSARGGGLVERHWRTTRFVRNRLAPTPWHFQQWNEVKSSDINCDCIVVGSDQVWHCGDWGDPRPFLLDGLPRNLPAIAYAVSLGMPSIPEEWRPVFHANLRRFSSVSVRESDAIPLLEPFGVHATHVLDPTQLLDAEEWRQLLGLRRLPEKSPRLVAYFLREPPLAAWPVLEAFAQRTGTTIDLFTQDFLLPPPRSPRQWLHNLSRVSGFPQRPIVWRHNAGPEAFVQAMSNAKWILSDSFHALMFASIFDKDIRFLRPSEPNRIRMFSRVEDFAKRYVNGTVICDTVSTALDSLRDTSPVTYNISELSLARSQSLTWLRTALSLADKTPTPEKPGKSASSREN